MKAPLNFRFQDPSLSKEYGDKCICNSPEGCCFSAHQPFSQHGRHSPRVCFASKRKCLKLWHRFGLMHRKHAILSLSLHLFTKHSKLKMRHTDDVTNFCLAAQTYSWSSFWWMKWASDISQLHSHIQVFINQDSFHRISGMVTVRTRHVNWTYDW